MKQGRVYKVLLTIALAALLLLTGCGRQQISLPSSDTATNTGAPATPSVNNALIFQSMCLKVKSDIIYNRAGYEQKVMLEIYVDEDGDGEGLLGFGDTVLNVAAYNNKLFIILDNITTIAISDINARGYFSDIAATSIADMGGVGFYFTDEFPTAFNGSHGDMIVRTQYAQSSNTYDSKRISDESEMTLLDALLYSLDYLNIQSIPDPDGDKVPTTDATTFYVDDKYGVIIDDFKYSISDTCNPDDYFAGLTPEGFLYSTEYKEDVKLTLTHISYISTTGRTSITTLDNYVQAIQTNADFDFLGFVKGMSAKDVKYGLAYKLSKREAEEYTAFNEDIVVDSFKANTYYCHLGNLSFELRLKSNVLAEFYITKPLGFS